MNRTNDIVNSLRTLSNGFVPVTEATAMLQAAAEIERLRHELKEARKFQVSPELAGLLREFFVHYPIYAHGICCYNDLRRDAKRDLNYSALPALTRLNNWVENVVIYNIPPIDNSEA
jgi:hypothetical protein